MDSICFTAHANQKDFYELRNFATYLRKNRRSPVFDYHHCRALQRDFYTGQTHCISRRHSYSKQSSGFWAALAFRFCRIHNYAHVRNPVGTHYVCFAQARKQPYCLLALLFNLVSISVEAVSDLSIFAALFPLSGSNYLNAFEPQQLNVLSYLTFRMHASGYNISLVFFGMNCFFWGYLVYKSVYFPKIIGVLLMICAVCYVTNSFAWFLAPKFAATLVPAILVPCLIAELSLCLWLMIKGVQMPKWESRVNGIQTTEAKNKI